MEEIKTKTKNKNNTHHHTHTRLHFQPYHPFNFSNQPSFHPPLSFNYRSSYIQSLPYSRANGKALMALSKKQKQKATAREKAAKKREKEKAAKEKAARKKEEKEKENAEKENASSAATSTKVNVRTLPFPSLTIHSLLRRYKYFVSSL
jgi:type IV secretory pathway VirB10-like protein